MTVKILGSILSIAKKIKKKQYFPSYYLTHLYATLFHIFFDLDPLITSPSSAPLVV